MIVIPGAVVSHFLHTLSLISFSFALMNEVNEGAQREKERRKRVKEMTAMKISLKKLTTSCNHRCH